MQGLVYVVWIQRFRDWDQRAIKLFSMLKFYGKMIVNANTITESLKSSIFTCISYSKTFWRFWCEYIIVKMKAQCFCFVSFICLFSLWLITDTRFFSSFLAFWHWMTSHGFKAWVDLSSTCVLFSLAFYDYQSSLTGLGLKVGISCILWEGNTTEPRWSGIFLITC